MNYDIVIPVVDRNFQTLDLVISYLKENITHRNIILIGNKLLKEKGLFFECKFIDENKLYGELNYNSIKNLIIRRDSYAGWRTGWYLQQFLKMSYSFVCQNEYYLVWDADTIPIRKIQMFDIEGIPLFDISEEYHRPYFTTMNKIFNGKIKKNDLYSYISEHMLIRTQYMQRLISEIERNKKLDGKYYYEKIMNSIRNVDLMHSGFSEFETYGNYVKTIFPDKYKIRKLKSLRSGDCYLHYPPIGIEIQWAKESYDIVTMENRKKICFDIDEKMEYLMNNYTLEEVVNMYSIS